MKGASEKLGICGKFVVRELAEISGSKQVFKTSRKIPDQKIGATEGKDDVLYAVPNSNKEELSSKEGVSRGDGAGSREGRGVRVGLKN